MKKLLIVVRLAVVESIIVFVAIRRCSDGVYGKRDQSDHEPEEYRHVGFP